MKILREKYIWREWSVLFHFGLIFDVPLSYVLIIILDCVWILPRVYVSFRHWNTQLFNQFYFRMKKSLNSTKMKKKTHNIFYASRLSTRIAINQRNDSIQCIHPLIFTAETLVFNNEQLNLSISCVFHSNGSAALQ